MGWGQPKWEIWYITMSKTILKTTTEKERKESRAKQNISLPTINIGESVDQHGRIERSKNQAKADSWSKRGKRGKGQQNWRIGEA